MSVGIISEKKSVTGFVSGKQNVSGTASPAQIIIEDSSVYNAKTRHDFPSVGDVNVIYKAESERLIYQWNPDESTYEALCEIPDDEAVHFTPQTLTPEQQVQARENIGAVAFDEVIHFTPQTLTEEQQAQARENIGAAAFGEGGALAATDDGSGNVTMVQSGDENDHIVEQGRNSGWDYRKWKSGVAECWRTVTATVKTTDWKDSGMMSFFSYGLFWTKDIKIQLPYPLTFASRPVETAGLTNGTVWFPLTLVSTTGKQTDKTDSYRICTYKIPEQDIEVTISFHVIGKWK